MRHRALGCSSALLASLVARAGYGQAPPPVRFHACDSLDVPATTRLLALERRSLAAATPAEITITCSEDETVVIVATREGDAQARTLDLANIAARAKPRIVALAAAELDTMAVPPAAPPPAPTPPQPRAPLVADALVNAGAQVSRPPRPARIDLGGIVRSLPSLGTWNAGVRAAITAARVPLSDRTELAAKASLAWEQGQQRLDYGTGSLTGASAGAGILVSFKPLRAPRLQPFLGFGAQVGWAWMRGSPTTGAASGLAHAAPWGGPAAEAGASFAVTSRLALALGVDAGYVVGRALGRGAEAGSQRFGFSGAWFAPHLSLAWHL